MHKLQTIFLLDHNGRIENEFKTDYLHINVTSKVSFLPRKNSRANRGNNRKGFPLRLPQQFLKNLNQMLNSSIKDVPNVTWISFSSMEKSYLENNHKQLSTKLCDHRYHLLNFLCQL